MANPNIFQMFLVVSLLGGAGVTRAGPHAQIMISPIAMLVSGVRKMKRPKKPAQWQLDVFMLVMIVNLLLLMWAELPASWYPIIEGTWAVLTLCGMSLWVWVNREALRENERRRRTKRKRQPQAQSAQASLRSIPLTPVQRRFLDVMDRQRPR
jgi:hypothetical protein